MAGWRQSAAQDRHPYRSSTLTDGGYVGLAVNTAARICSAGHGGQIVLSSDAVRAVEASAPRSVSFRSLGAHRLQGLPEPQPLFQLEAPDLPENFPAPRTTKARGLNHVVRTRSRSR
jgi:class 3 adenylate cyclase